jgi:hypothetical protein
MKVFMCDFHEYEFLGIILELQKVHEWKFIEPKSDEEFQPFNRFNTY